MTNKYSINILKNVSLMFYQIFGLVILTLMSKVRYRKQKLKTGKGKTIAGVSSQCYHRNVIIAILSSQFYHHNFIIAAPITDGMNLSLKNSKIKQLLVYILM
jgi:hypothetical protein